MPPLKGRGTAQAVETSQSSEELKKKLRLKRVTPQSLKRQLYRGRQICLRHKFAYAKSEIWTLTYPFRGAMI